jgi:hypothetical protein
MPRTVAMIFALRGLLAPASPAIEAPNLATPRPEIVRVADAYVKAMLASDGLLKEVKITAFMLTHTESTISGDTAYDVGTYTQRLSTRDGMVDDTGKYIVMLKRTGRDWKIAYAIHNSDRPSMMPGSGASR